MFIWRMRIGLSVVLCIIFCLGIAPLSAVYAQNIGEGINTWILNPTQIKSKLNVNLEDKKEEVEDRIEIKEEEPLKMAAPKKIVNELPKIVFKDKYYLFVREDDFFTTLSGNPDFSQKMKQKSLMNAFLKVSFLVSILKEDIF